MQKLRLADDRRFLPLPAAVLFAAAVVTFGSFANRGSSDGFLVPAARAQSKFEEDVHQKLQSLIARMRHRNAPDGITKSSGRIGATQIAGIANADSVPFRWTLRRPRASLAITYLNAQDERWVRPSAESPCGS